VSVFPKEKPRKQIRSLAGSRKSINFSVSEGTGGLNQMLSLVLLEGNRRKTLTSENAGVVFSRLVFLLGACPKQLNAAI